MLTKDTQIKALTRPGSYHIGNGAYVQVSPTVTKSFKFRYTRRGKAREMGLGPYPEVTLAEARQKALDARKALADGLDPIEVRDAQRRIQDAPKHTFQAVALEYIAAHEVEWKNPKHRAQWKSSLRDYAFPVIGTIPVDQITADEIYSVLIQGTPDGPLWHARTETASRVRQRIETILSYAKARKWRTGENPAAWKDNLQPRLAAKAKISPVRHHEALPYRDMPVFMAMIRQREGIVARALEFTILTAKRTSEVLNMTWHEADLLLATWIIPAERMKSNREHKEPLSQPARDLLTAFRPANAQPQSYVFPGEKYGQPLSNMSMTMLLRRMGYPVITMHGFRSTFRDWATEETTYQNHVVEKALAHAIDDAVEANYRRGDLYGQRMSLMGDWAMYCCSR